MIHVEGSTGVGGGGYLAGLFDLGLDADEDLKVLHHLVQSPGVRLPLLTHVKHQTHREAVLHVHTHDGHKRTHTHTHTNGTMFIFVSI